MPNCVHSFVRASSASAVELLTDLRVRKKDLVADESTLYYYNGNWQVLAETDANGTTQRWFVYGNYIDEALMMVAACLEQGGFAHRLYYIQDGLYSTRALVADKGWVIEEQTYYDVYGRAGTWTSGDADADGDIDATDRLQFTDSFGQSECDAGYNWRCDVDNSGVVSTTEWPAFSRNGSTPANQQSYFTNPYYFQGKRVDVFDDGGLQLMSWPYRDYSTYLGRWLEQEKRGVMPNDAPIANVFDIPKQYSDGIHLLEAFASNPVTRVDVLGLRLYSPGQYVPNSGDISIWLGQSGRRGGLRRNRKLLETRATIYFYPNETARRCCDEITFGQIATSQVDTALRFRVIGWHLDVAFPHPGSHPWKPYAANPIAELGDRPGYAGLSSLLVLHQNFISCAICTKGCEVGANYGCVHWGHSFIRFRDPVTKKYKYTVIRWAFSGLSSGIAGSGVQINRQHETPIAPAFVFHLFVDPYIP